MYLFLKGIPPYPHFLTPAFDLYTEMYLSEVLISKITEVFTV